MRKQLKIIGATIGLFAAATIEADMPMSPGTFFQPMVIESAREMMWLYPSSATLVLPRLNAQEKQEIADLIQNKNRTYLTIKRDVSVAAPNWKRVGTKKTFSIWQLHIQSPDALGMQAFFHRATLIPELKIKIYSGQKAVTSYINEYLGDVSKDPKNFWSTRVPGDTIVIEVWIPQDSNLDPDTFPFEIKSINHYFRDVSGDLPKLQLHSEQQGQHAQQLQQNTCPVFNNLCNFGDGRDVHRAIGYMEYTDSRGRTGSCTGSFLNNGNGVDNQELYFLTAFHCISPGFSQNTRRGRSVNALILNSLSRCSVNNFLRSDRLVATDIRFIAASEAADWALLWVNKNNLRRADGLPLGALSPFLLGWSSIRLALDSTVETLHHAQNTIQNYARFQVTALQNASRRDSQNSRTLFEPCQNATGCTHYRIDAITGGIAGGASGSSWWNPRYQVRAVLTNGFNRCSGTASRFDKIYEDGRVGCALNQGNRYYPRNTSGCDDSARPLYNNDPPPPPPRLSTLALSTGTLHPIFDPAVVRYFAAVADNTRQITLRLNAEESNNTITVNGNRITGTATIPLGSNTDTITVGVRTADGSRTNTYIINIIRLAQRNFDPVGTWEITAIENINLQCPLLPNLSPDDFDLVGREYDIVTTSGGLNLIDRVDSQTYTEIGRNIPNRYKLQYTQRESTFESTVTTDFILVSDEEVIGAGVENGQVTNLEHIPCLISYTLSAKKAARSTAMLEDISLSAGTLNSSFTGVVREYSATVDSDVGPLGITIETSHIDQSVTINGSTLSRGLNPGQFINSTVPLNVGDNTIVIGVTSADGRLTSSYTLQVTRRSPALIGLSLSPGMLSPGFSREIARYTATVNSDIQSIRLTPTANSPRHDVTITANGNSISGNVVPLNVGSNTLTIAVITQDNRATARYTLFVTRLEPCLTALSLVPGSLSPNFMGCSDTTINYRAIVANTISQIGITATANSTAHTITYNGNRNSTVALSVGDNTITVSVTTADGMAARDYNLIVRRLSTATLTGITVEADSQMLTLNPDFSLGDLDYYVNVENTMTTVTMTPTALSGRTIRVRYTPDDGTAINRVVASGDAVTIMPLFYGRNNIYIDVMHNDAMERYRLTVIIGILLRIKLFLEGPLQ